MSWGEKLATPSSYDPKDFFQTGFDETNAIGITGGTERNQTYFSAASVNTRGIIPTTSTTVTTSRCATRPNWSRTN